MPLSSGPNTVSDSSIVFNYDTGDISNSWRGKPTTNILTGVGYTYGNQNQTFFKSTYGKEFSYIPGLGRTVENDFCLFLNDFNGGSGNCCPSVFSFGGFSVSGNTTYTYQIIYRTSDGYANPNYMYHYEFGPSGYITEYGLWDGSRLQDLGGGWTHAWGTFTSHPNATSFSCFLFHYQYIWTKIQIAGVMLTQGNNIIPPSQFLAPQASRSNTDALLDISGRGNTINLSNVSFDSNAQIIFDGTDDYTSVNNSTSLQVADVFTISAWIFPTNLNSRYGIFSTRRFNTAGSWQFEVGTASGGTNRVAVTGLGTWIFETPNNVISPNVWTNICFVKGGNGIQGGTLYINGTSISPLQTTAYTILNNSDVKVIGSGTNLGQFFPGRIANVALYNRILSATEVQSNYNEFRTRFNLP